MIKIVNEKCIGCGLCAQDCPAGNLLVTEGKASVRGACMECGHCFAVCPAGAVEVTGYPTDGIVEFEGRKPFIDGDTLLDFIKSRRSIRNFQDKKIERETWSKVLEAGRFTATAVNRQDVNYVVVQDDMETVKKHVWDGFHAVLAGMKKLQGENDPFVQRLQAMCDIHEKNPERDPLFFNTPSLLVITSSSVLNGGLAASNIELMANAEGLGVLYSGFIQRALNANEAACQYLGIRKEEICACLLVGYPNVKYQRSVPRKEVNIQWK